MNRARQPRGRLNPLLRIGLYLPTLAIVGALFATLGGAVVGALAPTMLASLDGSTSGGESVLSRGAFMVAIVLVTFLFRRLFDRRGFAQLGFQRDPGWLTQGLLGFGLGAFLMTAILAVELALGSYRLAALDWQLHPPRSTLGLLALTFVGFVVVAFDEELISRGYILQNLALAWGTPAAVALSSALFALAHLFNPGAGPMATVGLFFAGLLLAAGYVATGRLWFSMGLHLSWNYFQGPLYGFSVSGLETGSVLMLTRTGDDALTGGRFGPEASLVGIAANLLGLFLLWWWSKRMGVGPSSLPTRALSDEDSEHGSSP